MVRRIERRLYVLSALEFTFRHCAMHGASFDDVVTSGSPGRAGPRVKSIADARHRLWTVLRHTLALSYPELATFFEVDHTTILSAVHKIEAKLAAEHQVAA